MPQAVFEEVVIGGAGRPGSGEIGDAPWLEVRPVVGGPLLEDLSTRVGRGEGEAIAIAAGLGTGVLLLIDDRSGRRLAREAGIHVLGSAGVLVEAKTRGIIPLVGPILDEFCALGLYLSRTARNEALLAAGEAPSAESNE